MVTFAQRTGLYAIVDADALAGRDPLPFADALLSSAPLFALQLRAKRWSARQTLAVARSLRERCDRAGVPMVVNDRPDVALLAGAALHVGQDDLPLEDLRALGRDLRIGVSTHNLAQLDAALALRPDYVALGPIFDTRSKDNPDPTVGLEVLAIAAQRAQDAGVPLVAIGGITVSNAPSIRAAGASSAALISALCAHADDPSALARTTRALHDALSA